LPEGAVRLRSPVGTLAPDGATWRLRAGDEALTADALVLAAPAWAAATLLAPLDADLGRLLRTIEYASSATVKPAYPSAAVPGRPPRAGRGDRGARGGVAGARARRRSLPRRGGAGLRAQRGGGGGSPARLSSRRGARIPGWRPGCPTGRHQSPNRLDRRFVRGVDAGRNVVSAAPPLPPGLVAFVKRECPTCQLVAPVLARLAAETELTVFTQDDPAFPGGTRIVDDRSLEYSWHHGIETVPTLLRVRDGEVVGRATGWQRDEWEALTGMAGCKPEYLPVVLGAVEAACTEAFNIHGVLATTMPVGPVIVVNGSIRHAIGMNSGINVFGQGNRANLTIGRALQLVVRNVGGGRPGEVDRATFGNPGKIAFCFAEDEERSPWPPLAADFGARPGTDAVVLFTGEGPRSIVDQQARDPESLARTLA